MTFIPDSEIKDEELLYRAIHPSFWNEEEDRPSSALFKDNNGVSVDRDGERREKDIILFLLTDRNCYGVGRLNAGETRNSCTFLKPDKNPQNDYHSLILASKSKNKLPNSVARILSKLIYILSPPTS